MADDLKDAIKQNAEGPKQASADGVSTQQHSMSDQIEADKYLAGKDIRTPCCVASEWIRPAWS